MSYLTFTTRDAVAMLRACTLTLWPIATWAAGESLGATLGAVTLADWLSLFLLSGVSGLVALLHRVRRSLEAAAMNEQGAERQLISWWLFALCHMAGAIFVGAVAFMLCEAGDLNNYFEAAVIALSSWRGVFWAVTIAALIGLVLTGSVLKETRPAAARLESSLGSALRGYALLLRDRHYMGLVFIGSFAMGGFFIYLANSPFVLIDHYGLTPTQYSLAFALNAAAFIGMSQFTGRLSERFGLVPVVKVAASASAAAMVLLLGYYLAGGDQLAVLIGLYFVASAFMGLVIPSTSVLALEDQGEHAGLAASLGGTMQMVAAGVVVAAAGPFLDGTVLPMLGAIAFCGAVALGLSRLLPRHAALASSADNA